MTKVLKEGQLTDGRQKAGLMKTFDTIFHFISLLPKNEKGKHSEAGLIVLKQI